jgi:fatty acid desaturase
MGKDQQSQRQLTPEQQANLERHLEYQDQERNGPKKGFYYWLFVTLALLLVVVLATFFSYILLILLVPFVVWILLGFLITKNH